MLLLPDAIWSCVAFPKVKLRYGPSAVAPSVRLVRRGGAPCFRRPALVATVSTSVDAHEQDQAGRCVRRQCGAGPHRFKIRRSAAAPGYQACIRVPVPPCLPEVMVTSIDGGLRSVAQTESSQNVGDVALDCRFAYEQRFGDLTVGRSGAHQPQDLAFTFSQFRNPWHR